MVVEANKHGIYETWYVVFFPGAMKISKWERRNDARRAKNARRKIVTVNQKIVLVPMIVVLVVACLDFFHSIIDG